MSTLHQVNLWNDKEIGSAAVSLMPHSLLWLPDRRALGDPGTAIVFASRWGGYPYDAAPRAIGPALADRGIAFLSLGLRRRGVEGQLAAMPDDDLRDVKIGVDYLVSLGFSEILLAGEEVGALSVTRYQAKSRDLRVKGVALIRPISDLARWLEEALGVDRYARLSRHSLVAARQGAGLDDLVDLTVPGPDGAPFLIHQFSAAWLAWWGRIADTSLSRIVEEVLTPVLIVAGADPFDTKVVRERATASRAVRVASSGQSETEALAEWAESFGGSAVTDVALDLVTATVGEREQVGLLWTPAEPTETAIILVHGYTGTAQSPLYAKIGPLFARDGIAALAIEMGRSGRGGNLTAPFARDGDDIDAFVRLLVDRGYRKIVLAGASLGSISITHYQATRPHPNVVAQVHLAPTEDCGPWLRRGMGEELYLKTVAQAEAAVAAGEGETALIDTVHRRGDPDRYHILMRYPQRAASWLTWWGPAAETANSSLIGRITVPLLLVSGTEDSYNTPERMNLLQSLATASPVVEQIWYQDCDHPFTGFERRIVEDVTGWLRREGA